MNEVVVSWMCLDPHKKEMLRQEIFPILSPPFKEYCDSFFFEKDRFHFLAGRKLLVDALVQEGLEPDLINHLKQNEFGRPFLENTPDFNISHSGDLVVLAWCKEGKVGVDAEEKREVDFTEYEDFFTPSEHLSITNHTNQSEECLRIWTRKEALGKLLGKGLSEEELPTFEVLPSVVIANKQRLYFHELSLHPAYIVHLLTNLPKVNFALKEH